MADDVRACASAADRRLRAAQRRTEVEIELLT
jgi:hypothetical protein